MDYDEIISAIENAPLTWSGAIMIKAVEAAAEKKFFASGEKLMEIVTTIVNRKGEPQ